MNDYWLRQKYRMSGLKLLAEIASMSSDAKEKIFSDWFAYCDEDSDPICRKITRCARDGICANKPIQEIVDEINSVFNIFGNYERAYDVDFQNDIKNKIRNFLDKIIMN